MKVWVAIWVCFWTTEVGEVKPLMTGPIPVHLQLGLRKTSKMVLMVVESQWCTPVYKENGEFYAAALLPHTNMESRFHLCVCVGAWGGQFSLLPGLYPAFLHCQSQEFQINTRGSEVNGVISSELRREIRKGMCEGCFKTFSRFTWPQSPQDASGGKCQTSKPTRRGVFPGLRWRNLQN